MDLLPLPEAAHAFATCLSTLWARADAGALNVVDAMVLRNRLEERRLQRHATLRVTPTGVFGWSVDALAWACTARLDIAAASNEDAAAAETYDDAVRARLVIKRGPLSAYTSHEVVHAMNVVAARWLFLHPTLTLKSYVRALELAGARHVARPHEDHGEYVSFCAAWSADIKARISIHEQHAPVPYAVPTEPSFYDFCDSLLARTASDVQRALTYKMCAVAWMRPGAVTMLLRELRAEIVPDAVTVCNATMTSDVHVHMRNFITDVDDLRAVGPPVFDPITQALVLFGAFDAWCKYAMHLNWLQRFCVLMPDYMACQYALTRQVSYPVVIQVLRGFNVWYQSRMIDCGDDPRRTLGVWTDIVRRDFEGRVLSVYVLPQTFSV
jgi:hypothetical protein